MGEWTFRCYVEANGKDAIRRWYDSLDAEVRGEVDAVLESLRTIPRKWWSQRRFRMLRGEAFKGMGRLRVRVNNVQYRLIGYSEKEWDFLIIFAFQRDHDPDYSKSEFIVQCRKGKLEACVSKTHECRFP